MNKVILIGRLTADPELRFAASTGKAVTNFRLAVDRPYSRGEKTDFFRVVVWGKQAESVAQYLRKGSQCAVEGSIHIDQYQDRDGNNRYSTDIAANQVQFLGSPNGGQKQERQQSGHQSTGGQWTPGGGNPDDDQFPTVEDEDIPF